MFPRLRAKKVYVGVSGGVDSAVSLAILKFLGYDVTGVFIKTWQPDFIKCTWPEERRDAISVCTKLRVPFLDLDLEKEYKEKVADYMIDSYRLGLTPNPDMLCNQEIKFGAFLEFANQNNIEYLATGHYARIKKSKNDYHLYRGKDPKKDQSYFLAMVPKDKLNRIIFPVGNFPKKIVRLLARLFRIPVYAKKDSQGICFLGMVKMEDFLAHYIDRKPGQVTLQNGEVVGTHSGVFFYTLGQRHGFVLNNQNANRQKLYVLAKNIKDNVLIVGPKEFLNTNGQQDINLYNFNFLEKDLFKEGKVLECQIRYQGKIKKAVVKNIDWENKKVKISFTEIDKTISPGQVIVFYHQGLCLGGGIVA